MAELNLVSSYRVGAKLYGPGAAVEVPDDVAEAISKLDGDRRKQYEQDAKHAQQMLPAGHPYLVLQGITNDAQPPQYEGDATSVPVQSDQITDVERQRLQAEGAAAQPSVPVRRGSSPVAPASS